jgi:hypothetical protein
MAFIFVQECIASIAYTVQMCILFIIYCTWASTRWKDETGKEINLRPAYTAAAVSMEWIIIHEKIYRFSIVTLAVF